MADSLGSEFGRLQGSMVVEDLHEPCPVGLAKWPIQRLCREAT